MTQMKDGRTHLAHKAEHTVDLDTQALVAVQVCGADEGDTESLPWSLIQAALNLEEVLVDEAVRMQWAPSSLLAEVVTDKGYHSNDIAKTLKSAQIRSYLSEPDRGHRRWKKDPEAQAAVYGNRRRICGARGRALQRRRAEYTERSFAHIYETGGMRRTHLRGPSPIYKRLCIHGGAFNLGLVMRNITGLGTPRGLHRLWSALGAFGNRLKSALNRLGKGYRALRAFIYKGRLEVGCRLFRSNTRYNLQNTRFSTACYYPEPVAWAPNAIHATDIITRHVHGGEEIQNFHTIDHYTHAVHLSQYADKTSTRAGMHLLSTWANLGLPFIQQVDNENAFCGGHTHPRVIGRVVRLCLFVGIEPLFIPVHEAKRNYWIERFHSLWVSAFWSRQKFRDLAHVQAEIPTFLWWYHTRYQPPPCLQDKTPAQMRRGFQPIRLTASLRCLIPDPLPITAGRIHFIRKVDVHGNIRLLNEIWSVGSRWVGEYVWATVDTAEQILTIKYQTEAEAAWKQLKNVVSNSSKRCSGYYLLSAGNVHDVLTISLVRFSPKNCPRCRGH